MKVIIFSVIVAIGTAAQLPARVYLPQQTSQQQGSFTSSQSSHASSSLNTATGQLLGAVNGPQSGAVNIRPQQEAEKNALILKFEQVLSENGFKYSYETSNGIKAEESGNAAGSQGGFSYKGDDGITYTITFKADEGGFQAQGAHLPVAPPIPEAILLALEQNAKDEAAGIFDDGKYRPDKNDGSQQSSGQFTQTSGSFTSSSSSQNFGGRPGSRSFSPDKGYQY